MTGPQPVGEGRLVVIVEDNERNARLVRDVLTAHAFATETLGTGREAVARIPDLDADLVLLDVQLPDIDGFEVLGHLRRAGCDLPVVAVTAFAMPGDEERILHAGFDAYLAKPIDIATLATAVADLIDDGTGFGDRDVS